MRVFVTTFGLNFCARKKRKRPYPHGGIRPALQQQPLCSPAIRFA
jgi:hypothetical protein